MREKRRCFDDIDIIDIFWSCPMCHVSVDEKKYMAYKYYESRYGALDHQTANKTVSNMAGSKHSTAGVPE